MESQYTIEGTTNLSSYFGKEMLSTTMDVSPQKNVGYRIAIIQGLMSR
jgi:hypothetical protein